MNTWSPNPNAPPPQKMRKWEPPTGQAAPPAMRKWEPPTGQAAPPLAASAPQDIKLALAVSSFETKTKLRGKLASVFASASATLASLGDFALSLFDEAVRVEERAAPAAEPSSHASAPPPWESEGITVSEVRGVLVIVASQLADVMPGDVLVNVNDWPTLASLEDLATAWARGAAWKTHTILVQRGGATYKIELPRG